MGTWDPMGGRRLSTGRKFVSDVFVRTVFQVFNALRGLVFLPLIVRLYGTEGYSIWSQVILTIALLSPLMTLRLGAGLVRYMGRLETRQERADTFFTTAALVWVLSVAVLATTVLAKESLAFVMFDDRQLTSFAALFGLLLIMKSNFAFASSYYRAISALKTQTAILASEIVLEIATIYGLSLLRSSRLEEVLLAVAIIDALMIGGILVDIVRRDGLPRKLQGKNLSRLLRFSLPLIPAGIMYWVVNSSDRYVIVHLVGLNDAGIYSAAYRLAQILKLVLQPIAFVLLPVVTLLWEQGKHAQVRSYFARSVKWFLILGIPAAAGLVSLGPEILAILGTSEFVVSRGLVALLVVGELFVGLYQIYVYVIYLFEKTWIQPVLFSVLALLNLGLNLLLVPHIGILGAAITTFGAYLLQGLFVIAYTSRLLPFDIDWKTVGKAVLGGICVFFGTRYLPGRGIGHLVIAIAVGVAIYAAVIVGSRAASVRDIRELLKTDGESQ